MNKAQHSRLPPLQFSKTLFLVDPQHGLLGTGMFFPWKCKDSTYNEIAPIIAPNILVGDSNMASTSFAPPIFLGGLQIIRTSSSSSCGAFSPGIFSDAAMSPQEGQEHPVHGLWTRTTKSLNPSKIWLFK